MKKTLLKIVLAIAAGIALLIGFIYFEGFRKLPPGTFWWISTTIVVAAFYSWIFERKRKKK